MKKNYLNYILLLFPFLDFLTSIATWESYPSVGLLFKGIFLIFAVYSILKNAKEKKTYYLFLGLIFYGVIDVTYWIFKDSSALKGEIINLVKIYYLPILILLFGTNREKLSKKTIFFLYLEFLILYLFPYPFHLGHNISEVYPNKDLYLSYFYVGNELSNIFVLLLPVSIVYLIETNDKRFTILTVFLTICMLFLLGTKTMYLSILIIGGYFLFFYRKNIILKIKQYSLFFVMILFIGVGFLLWIPNNNLYQNIKTSLEFYEVDSISKLLTFENIDNIIYSNRLDFLKNVHENYKESNILEKIMGLGRTKINELKDIEIDIFDIFYSVGIVGFIVYVIFFMNVLNKSRVNGVYLFTFMLLLVISLFTGHVLISPMTTTYLASIFGIERKQYEKLDKKSIKKIKNCLNAQ